MDLSASATSIQKKNHLKRNSFRLETTTQALEEFLNEKKGDSRAYQLEDDKLKVREYKKPRQEEERSQEFWTQQNKLFINNLNHVVSTYDTNIHEVIPNGILTLVQFRELRDFVHKTITVSQDRTVKQVRDINLSMVVIQTKQEEIEKVIPLVIKTKIGEMMKLHIEDIDQRKVENEVFQKVIKTKADNCAI